MKLTFKVTYKETNRNPIVLYLILNERLIFSWCSWFQVIFPNQIYSFFFSNPDIMWFTLLSLNFKYFTDRDRKCVAYCDVNSINRRFLSLCEILLAFRTISTSLKVGGNRIFFNELQYLNVRQGFRKVEMAKKRKLQKVNKNFDLTLKCHCGCLHRQLFVVCFVAMSPNFSFPLVLS